jgi:hypothetical protein
MLKIRLAVSLMLALTMLGCSKGSKSGSKDEPEPTGDASDGAVDDAVDDVTDKTPSETGATDPDKPLHAYYVDGDDLFRVEARAGAAPVNISSALDLLSTGTRDRFASPSLDGAWFAIVSDRGGCAGECLIRVSGDLKTLALVRPGGIDAYVEGMTAMSPNGNTIVYPSSDGPHEIDLYRTDLADGNWSAPILLTAASTYGYNNMPAMTHDGTRVIFDCGAERYPESGATDACEVALDGSGFRKVVGPDALASARYDKVQFPHAGPDGLLFESSWPVDGDSPEIVWLLPKAGGDPVPIGKAFPNSVSPCALPDGRFFVLWLGRSGNDDGAHELTLVARDGTLISVLTPDVDVDDIGIGCGG